MLPAEVFCPMGDEWVVMSGWHSRKLDAMIIRGLVGVTWQCPTANSEVDNVHVVSTSHWDRRAVAHHYILRDKEALCRIFDERLADHEGCWWSENGDISYYYFIRFNGYALCSERSTCFTVRSVKRVHNLPNFLIWSTVDNQMQSERWHRLTHWH